MRLESLYRLVMAPNREYLDAIAERIARALSPLVPREYDVVASGGEITLGTRPIHFWSGYTSGGSHRVGCQPFPRFLAARHHDGPKSAVAPRFR